MVQKPNGNPIDILLVEDNPGDVRLVREVFNEFKVNNALTTLADGSMVMPYLRKEGSYAGAERPDLILLDLNLPKKDGRELLAEIKSDKNLKRIPVVVITTSKAEEDILKSYNLNANCYLTKPLDLNQFIEMVKSIEGFWLTFVKLPPK